MTNEQIETALKETNQDVTAAARLLDIPRSTLWSRLKKLGYFDKGTKTQESPPEPQHRVVRALERKAQQLAEEAKAERERRKVAEQDLAELEHLSELFNSVGDPKPTEIPRSYGGSGHATAVVCATDWHLEKRIDASTVNGLNEFNLDIARARIAKLWDKASYLIEFYNSIAEVDEIVLWLGGDLIQGQLHDDDGECTFAGPTEAIIEVQDHIASGIDTLSKLDTSLRVVCNYGNHSRTTKKTRHGSAWKHSWEWVAFKNLERVYQGIHWTIPQGYMVYTNIRGHIIRFHHGDAVKYNGGVGGLNIPMQKSIAQWNKGNPAVCSFNGHYHTYESHWTWESVGCLCGYDAFALSIKADFQPPTQSVVFFDKNRGKTLSIPIFLESVK